MRCFWRYYLDIDVDLNTNLKGRHSELWIYTEVRQDGTQPRYESFQQVSLSHQKVCLYGQTNW